MTAADHANTVRYVLGGDGSTDDALAALDALQAQAEASQSDEWAYVPRSRYEELKAAEAEAKNWSQRYFTVRGQKEAAEAERDRLADALRDARDWIDHSMHSANDDLEGGHALLNRIAALTHTEQPAPPRDPGHRVP